MTKTAMVFPTYLRRVRINRADLNVAMGGMPPFNSPMDDLEDMSAIGIIDTTLWLRSYMAGNS